MSKFALNTALPRYLRATQERVEAVARDYGLDFFPVIFEILTYDQMNEIAAYGGFPSRYPHWRYGMEYEQLSKSYEYGLSKIYEMVINNNPSYAYLLEGNSLTDQKLVMAHVYAHVDFFKNNFCFRSTDLDQKGNIIDPVRKTTPYDPDRRWIDKMANHGSRVARHIERHGINKVEDFIDRCLSLENLIDPWQPFSGRGAAKKSDEEEDETPIEVPRLRAKEYMESFINPEEYIEAKKKQLAKDKPERKVPERPERDVLGFLLAHAPLERWERDILEVIRDEALYFVPQRQTKIMNEGWAAYWHSKILTEKILDASEIIDYADNNAGVMATAPGRLNPYKLGVELFRYIEERWNKGRFGREWEECNDLDAKRSWDMRLGLGRQKIFQVRALYNDVTFIDEFLTPEFVLEQKLYTFGFSGRNDRFEIESRQFRDVKEKLLFSLTNFGDPYIRVVDANHQNRGELLLEHQHGGVDLRADYARETLVSLVRCWKRPVAVATRLDNKPVLLRYDGKEHSMTPYKL
ncbi:SpoVR family protein [Polyangium jinanense]|uniref:SpoVR family protein n=1 Tax=Polyangium jinanense TaxID=2829994 RepID=A0A9X3XDC0_9BACT|nr:SpoVR family protein [Polyangium jinanense]MDC3957395.1 SpoVR family protein [Polyangium jinanense]MDC3988217.1 SpoVR family protein [Polyangium jinanense]